MDSVRKETCIEQISEIQEGIRSTLQETIIPFWLARAVYHRYSSETKKKRSSSALC